MTPEEFEAGLDRWGGDLDAWPVAPGRSAAALLGASPAARRELAAMLRVERALRGSRRRTAPGTLHLVAHATAQRQERPPRVLWRLRAAACLAVLGAGFAYGALEPRGGEDWFGPAFAPAEPFDVN